MKSLILKKEEVGKYNHIRYSYFSHEKCFYIYIPKELYYHIKHLQK
jgi:hypothetical protein